MVLFLSPAIVHLERPNVRARKLALTGATWVALGELSSRCRTFSVGRPSRRATTLLSQKGPSIPVGCPSFPLRTSPIAPSSVHFGLKRAHEHRSRGFKVQARAGEGLGASRSENIPPTSKQELLGGPPNNRSLEARKPNPHFGPSEV